jgi:hypothetical protein
MYFSIFIVFSFLFKNEQIPVRVSKYLKVPYANNYLDLFRMQCKPYKNVHDGLYYVKAYDYRTYFYCKNDLITYDRKSNYEVAIFKYDFLKGYHIPLRFRKLKGIIKDEDTFWISVNDQVKFVVSRETELQDQKRYVAVINVLNGHSLLMASKEDEIHLGFLPLFHYIILPIIQFKKDSIIVYFVDLLNEKSCSISWNLREIKTLINTAVKEDEASGSYRRIKETILYDSITTIEDVSFHVKPVVEHIYDKSGHYPKILTDKFEIKVQGEEYKYNLKGLIINIEWHKDELTGILQFDRASFKIVVIKTSPKTNLVYLVEYTSCSLPCINSSEKTCKLSKTLSPNVSNISIKVQKHIIYNDGFYYLLLDSKGIEIIRANEYNLYSYDKPGSIYRYKQYMFIIKHLTSNKLVVVDTENNLIVIFNASRGVLAAKTEYKMLYYFYPIEESNKIVFVHNNLQFMIVLDMTKLRQVLDKVREDRTKEEIRESYRYDVIEMEQICNGYYMPELIAKYIQSELQLEIADAQLHILGHYFDNKNCKLYFIVKLVRQDTQIIVLLVWNCLSDGVKFKISCYFIGDRDNAATKVSNCNLGKLTKQFIFVNNMDLYGIMPSSDGLSKAESLYLATSRFAIHLQTNYFVDVEYKRFSHKLYEGKPSLRINRIGNIILMKYSSSPFSKEDDWDSKVDSSFCFILSQMQLVGEMRHIVA